MSERKEIYYRKSEALLKRCSRCRSSVYPPTPDRCDECTTGRKLRMLETEYSDVTGCSHDNWNK